VDLAMTIRRNKNPNPNFRLPTPFDPMGGDHAPLMIDGVYPHCAMMQVAAEDTHDDYVVCRGYDPRYRRFFDYDEDDLTTKPGIAVGKPFGSRRAGAYQIGQVYPAFIPLTRLGQTPGEATNGSGHPEDLNDTVEILYDENDRPVNWLLIESGTDLRRFELKTQLSPLLGFAIAHPLESDGEGNFAPDLAAAEEFTVYDVINRFAGWPRLEGTRSGSWGYAYKHPDSGWWEIVNMEQAAKYINFTLTENMGETNSGQATVTVDDWYDGTNPSIVYDEIKVYDPQNLHPGAASGAKGKARLDERDNQYHIVEMAGNYRNFAAVQTGWTNTKGAAGAGSWISETVSVKTCDYDDASETTGDAFDVNTMPKKNKDTALFTDYIIEWAYDSDGNKVVVSDIWDDPIGTVKFEAVDTANIRDGWALCNGENGTADLSARFIMSVDDDPLAAAGENAIADTGGYHGHGSGVGTGDTVANDHGDHPEQDVADALGNHLDNDIIGAIANHADHTHNLTGSASDGSGAGIVIGSPATTLGSNSTLTHTGSGSGVAHGTAGGGNDLEHGDSDNRPRYYVLAAIQRVS
jgi:hypothetical protein